jgi:transcription elongation factor Elf1
MSTAQESQFQCLNCNTQYHVVRLRLELLQLKELACLGCHASFKAESAAGSC